MARRKNQKLSWRVTFSHLKKSWSLVKSGRKNLIICGVFSLFICLCSVITPLLSAQMLLFLTDGLLEQLLGVAFFIFIVEVATNVFLYFNQTLFAKYWTYSVSEIQTQLASEILKLETSELDHHSSGVFIDRLNQDTKDIVSIFTQVGDVLIEMLANIGVLFAILVVSPYLFLFFLIVSILVFILEKIRVTKRFFLDRKRRKLYEKNTGLISELVRGIRDIKVLNAGDHFLEITRNRLEEANQENYIMERTNFRYTLVINTIKDIFMFLFILLGCFLVSIEKLTISGFLIAYMYRNRIQSLFTRFSRLVELLKEFDVSCERVLEVIEDERYQKEHFGKTALKKANGDFEFRNVTFSYNEKLPVLKGVSFYVHANETVSFVGKSGSGKSTIFSLIDRLYRVPDGSIFIDGIDINQLTRNAIRNNISIITQNPYIFNMSIRDNLRLVKENMTDQEMIYVCQMACLHDFVMSLPNGYDTVVGEGGLTLSGGQRQRLAIARAFLKKTEIILFDEATSALDNETQLEIQQALRNMQGEYTILIIAHRLSTVIDSDRIYVVDDGKIIAQGKHEELLKECSLYRNLYEKELK